MNSDSTGPPRVPAASRPLVRSVGPAPQVTDLLTLYMLDHLNTSANTAT
jgi:hypothetical protein